MKTYGDWLNEVDAALAVFTDGEVTCRTDLSVHGRPINFRTMYTEWNLEPKSAAEVALSEANHPCTLPPNPTVTNTNWLDPDAQQDLAFAARRQTPERQLYWILGGAWWVAYNAGLTDTADKIVALQSALTAEYERTTQQGATK